MEDGLLRAYGTFAMHIAPNIKKGSLIFGSRFSDYYMERVIFESSIAV
jgi:hypothetical protein